MKTLSLFAISAIVASSVVMMPIIVTAATPNNGNPLSLGGLVPCGNGSGSDLNTLYSSSNSASSTACDFQAFVVMIGNVTNFLIILSAPIFVGIMIWAGTMLLLNPGSVENGKKIRRVLRNTLIAFVIVLAGWLIVHVIASVLLQSSFNFFGI